MTPCDLCGAKDPVFVLNSSRLDGPLVRCRRCGFHYIGERRSNLVFKEETLSSTTEKLRDANREFQNLSLEEEHRLARLNAQDRLRLIRQYRPSGTLLEVGCARGDFLRVAREFFSASGVEPNEDLARDAATVAPVHQGLVDSEPGFDYDVAVSFHVIEHTDSPREFLAEIAKRLRPGGLVVLETPNIHSLPYRLFKSRWRQFIPEHYYFFDESTMTKMLQDAGFKVERIARVGKVASVSLVLNRLTRYFRPLRVLESLGTRAGLKSLVFHLDPLDIMIAFASKQEP